MTYYLTAHENTNARLIAHTLRTSDPIAADFVADHWEEIGFIVVRSEEA
jgi:hypothetical protein